MRVYDAQNLQLLTQDYTKDNCILTASACRNHCIQCCLRYNPEEVRQTCFPEGYISRDMLGKLLNFIDPERRIYIGEAGRFCAADFLSHPHWHNILQQVRSRFPDTRLVLSVLAVGLGEKDIDHISEHADHIDLSVHMLEADLIRRYIYKDYLQDASGLPVKDIIRSFSRKDISVSISANPMPNLSDWSQYDELVRTAAGCREIKQLGFSIPRFTRFAPEKIVKMTRCSPSELCSRITRWRRNHPGLLITCSDTAKQDLRAEVIYSTNSQIRPGDEICAIDGEAPLSCTHANSMLTDGRQKQVSLTKPDGDQQTVKLAGEDTVKAEEDIDPGVIDQIENRIMPHFNILMLTSGRAEKMIVKLAESIDAQTVRVLTVDNHFFGRDINCGGLLTVRDFLRARKEIKNPEEFDAAFTTGRFLGPDGKDLTGQHWITIERKFGLPFYFL